MNDIEKRLKELSNRLESAFELLNLETDRNTLKELKGKSQTEDFWSNSQVAQDVMQEIARLEGKITKWDDLSTRFNNLSELVEMGNDEGTDISADAIRELDEIEKIFETLEFGLLFHGDHDSENVILTINAGSGGVDAQDWAEMLLKMYLKYCEKGDLRAIILHKTEGDEAGIKSASVEIKGDHAYGKLKSEHGVHRLVRISPFDADKARHTSFAMVEVVPEIAMDKSEIDDKDLRIDVFRSGGHGGQSVNTTDSAVRITHTPTGLTATCQNERSQLQNKEMCLRVLSSKLRNLEEEKHRKELAKIRGENLSAEWGNQIRSYVLQPYTLVKDHRTSFETADVQSVLGGRIDEFIEAYLRSPLNQ